ncbi:MAG: cytochrome c [Chloroflexi bacterium]|nr:cytochrome c [Chloroflexota bacterium]
MNRKTIPWIVMLGMLGIFALAFALFLAEPAHALPEFSGRTGESCATCHVNPGGGGPRTMRGLVWAARGRADSVPELPGVLLAPGVKDGHELYQIACASCHGQNGEGMFGLRLIYSGVSEAKIRGNILRGRLKSGMPAFEGQFTDQQLQALIAYTLALVNAETTPAPDTFPLDVPQFQVDAPATPAPSGGN